MKFRSFLGCALALCASVFLSSCGGGGAASNGGIVGGTLFIQPAAGTIFAGVPATFTITGGRTPYTLTSTEPELLAVPQTLEGHSFEVLAPNPSVIDAGLTAEDLPVRTVTITVRDATGQGASATIKVARNFLTGYGFSFTSNACATPPPATATDTIIPTAGCDTVVQVRATFNGNIRANATFKFDVVSGNFSFVDPTTGNTVPSITTTTDHNGIATAVMRVPSNGGAQIGVFRITDVASGASSTNAFTINGNSNATSLTAVPNSFDYTAALNTQCGTGTGDFFVFGGSPPYSAASSDPNVAVRAVDANSQPGVFEITAGNPGVCLTNATIVVTDAVGAHTTVTVSTHLGSTAPPAPPPPAFKVQPTTITLTCGQSGSVTATGGSGQYAAAPSNGDITATVSGNVITLTRAADDFGTGPYPTPQTVNITDGSTIVKVTANVPATCP